MFMFNKKGIKMKKIIISILILFTLTACVNIKPRVERINFMYDKYWVYWDNLKPETQKRFRENYKDKAIPKIVTVQFGDLTDYAKSCVIDQLD